jgi:ABC-type Fe3+-citrate transport system substrate-binding protein
MTTTIPTEEYYTLRRFKDTIEEGGAIEIANEPYFAFSYYSKNEVIKSFCETNKALINEIREQRKRVAPLEKEISDLKEKLKKETEANDKLQAAIEASLSDTLNKHFNKKWWQRIFKR